MRQWTTALSNEYEIDQRKKEDLLEALRLLAASYVPEWQFDTENPDMGSVIALLYAEQMEENLKRYNTVLERYYTELVNMLGISLKPAFPAQTMVQIRLADQIPGMLLPKGVKLLGSSGEKDNLVFETKQQIYLTGSKIQAMFMARAGDGKVIPIQGSFPPIDYVSPQESTGEEPMENFPVRLFDFRKPGYGKYGLLMYHRHIFDTQSNEIGMRLLGADGSRILDGIENGDYTLSFYGENGFQSITDVHRAEEELLLFSKEEECGTVTLEGEEYSLLLLEAKEPQEHTVWVEDIRFSASGTMQEAQFIWNGTTELGKDEFAPFGDTLNLFSELYIGHNEYFSKPGAMVTVTFQSSLKEHLLRLTRPEEEDDLRIIKRKQKKKIEDTPAEVYADEISLEYDNGTGWRRLETDVRIQTFFTAEGTKECRFTFRVPSDWAETEVGGYQGYALRMQLLAAADCYFRPARHHYPVIRNLKISYTYEGCEQQPERLSTWCGGRKKDRGDLLAKQHPIPVFGRNRYGKTGLYIGFDKPMEGGPVSLLLRLEETVLGRGGSLAVYYSVKEGFARLKCSDGTDGLMHTGILQFMPPSDMVKKTLEGQHAFWIVLTDHSGSWEEEKTVFPALLGVDMNAVEAANTETQPEEFFYLDEVSANMSFALNAHNILSADVWVNETNGFSEQAMRRMLKEEPDRVSAEYDFRGEITEFYVRWEETDTFDLSVSGDRHYCLDRMNSRIHFGDGVHVQIPRNVTGTAFKVVLRCCNGEAANLAEGQINGSMGNILFADQIRNPVRSYGGMNMESMDSALRRGTVLLGGRRRLVSAWDYEREALSFSSGISQVKAVAGMRRNGVKDDRCLSLVVLMKDYRNGSASFLNLKTRLMKHLLTECEVSVGCGQLEVTEPMFVYLSVDAWVKTSDMRDIFTMQTALIGALEEYLDPAGSERWEIGQIPGRSQIELKLIMEKGRAALEHVMITARCEDADGVMHEVDADEMSRHPFAVVRSGTHQIHFNER